MAACFFQVPLLHGQIQNRRKPSAIPGGDATLKEAHVPDGISIKGGKVPEEVIGVVNGDAIEKNQVLVVGASADIDSRGSFISRFDPWKQLNGFQGI